MEQQISLEDQVNKIKLSKPSIIDTSYYQNPDDFLDQKISDIIHYIKKKSTNIIKFITKAQFLGYKMLIVVLERQAIFYQCTDKVIIKCLNFKYSNVRKKILSSYLIKQKNTQKNYSRIFKPTGSEAISLKNMKSLISHQEMDKVNPMSKRTDQNLTSPRYKSRKNTNQTQQLKNILGNNMKGSKLASSVSVYSQAGEQDKPPRSVTMMDYQSVGLLNRSITKNSKRKQNSLKKQYYKIRSSDTRSILRLVTDSKIEGGIQAIKAYKNSIQTFQKYVNIDKSKIQKQKQLLDQIKLPSGLNIKFDYKKSIRQMKGQGKQLQHKKKIIQKGEQSKTNTKHSYQISNRIKTQIRSRPKSKFNNKTEQQQNKSQTIQQQKHEYKSNVQNQSDAFVALQKKILQIQSISFFQNYMLISLMNCQVRLYSFKKSIHGFSQQLIFQKNYNCVVSYVLIYKSAVRKLCNICVVLSKFSSQNHGASGGGISATQQLNPSTTLGTNINIRATHINISKKDTQILVYQLCSQMQIQKQVYSTYLTYSPIIQNMLPLGIGGFIQSSNFFILQLNCTTKTRSQIKTIETVLHDPDTGKKLSISSMKCHKNLVNLYFGCKNGFIIVFDRLAQNVRIKNKISNHQILQIHFVNEGKQVLFWDLSGKIGIFDSQTLTVSHISSLMNNQCNSSLLGEGRRLWGMIPFFSQNQFLVYGDRVIELINLVENHEKKFNLQKHMKIFNRRISIKSKKTQLGLYQKATDQQKTIALNEGKTHNKKIHNYFNTPRSLIMVTCQGQVLVYDRNACYIGSYFTLNYSTLTQCVNCPSIKYLHLLYQNNDMQVVNIYTQQELISIINVKQQVYDIFFCHSSVYFCGYLSSRKFQLNIYGHPDQKYSNVGNKSGSVRPIVSIRLYNLIMDIPDSSSEIQSKLSKISKTTGKSINSMTSNVDIQLYFYKGSMIIVDLNKSELLFLYKKSYTRNLIIKCQQYTTQRQHIHQSNNSLLIDQLKISSTCIDIQMGRLAILLNNFMILIVNLESKAVTNKYTMPIEKIKNILINKQKKIQKNLQKHGKSVQISNKNANIVPKSLQIGIQLQPTEHFYQSVENLIYIIWKVTKFINNKVQENQPSKYIYTILSLEQNEQENSQKVQSQCKILHVVRAEQNPHLHPHMHHHHPSTHEHSSKDNQLQMIGRQDWISSPFLIGSSLLTMSRQQTFFNLYRIKKDKNDKNKSQAKQEILSPNSQSQSLRKYSQTGQKIAEIQYFRIQPA